MQASQLEAQKTAHDWFQSIAAATDTPAGEPLRIPPLPRHGPSPFHRPLTWKEVDALEGEARDLYFGREVEGYKRMARSWVLFLFPEVGSKGLFTGDKEKIFTVASRVWPLDPDRAECLLWALDKEYPETREGVGRGWVGASSEEFMIYTALYPPPIDLGH